MKHIITLLFFFSGISGLLLETIWFRQLATIFGSTSLASGTITAAFIGGLGIGSLVFSYFADKIKKRFLTYGILELFIGIYAVLSPLVLDSLNQFQASVFGGDYIQASAYSVMRFAVIFIALLPPTVAMGATLPLLVKSLTEKEANIGSKIGLLYGVNTTGAFAGVLVAGFYLLPKLGQSNSIYLAATVSLLVGALALLLGFFEKGESNLATPKNVDKNKNHPERKPLRPYVLLSAFMFFSGLTAMLVQVGYTRVLAIILGSSVYSFTIIVAVFLAGIGLGSLIYSAFLSRRFEPYQLLAASQLILGVSLVAGIRYADKLPKLWLYIAKMENLKTETIFTFNALVVSAMLLLPALAMGIAFPAAMKLISASVKRLGKDVGRAYFLNTTGSIAGSFLAAFVLIPAIGLQTTLIYSAGLAIIWAAIFFSTKQGFLFKKRALILLPIAIVSSSLLMTMDQWDMVNLTRGMYRLGVAKKVSEQESRSRSSIIYYKDGPVATVSVERLQDVLTMRINGKVEASNRFDMPTQVVVGLLPILLHEKSEGLNAALIGYGSGVTAGSMLMTPIARLTAVEIEPRVIEAARYFQSVNMEPESDSRIKTVVGDARTVLGYSRDKYDVIVSEPSNPWVSGASGLFTEDFYRMMKNRLNEDGVFAQWIQLYELSPEHLKVLVRTFREVFPNTLVFSAAERGVDLVLLGREKPWKIDLKELLKRVTNEDVKIALRMAVLGGAYDILSLLSVTDSELEEFAGSGKLNTDDNGLVEFAAPKDMIYYDSYNQNAIDFHFSTKHGHFLPLLTNLGNTPDEQANNLATLALHLLAHGRAGIAYEMAIASQKITVNDLSFEVMEVCEMTYLKPSEWPPLLNAWMLEEKDEDFGLLAMAVSEKDPSEALRLARKLSKKHDSKMLQYTLGILLLKAYEFEQSYEILGKLAADESFRKQNPEVDFFAGRAADRVMKFQESIRYLARFNLWRKSEDLPLNPNTDENGETIEIEVNVPQEDLK